MSIMTISWLEPQGTRCSLGSTLTLIASSYPTLWSQDTSDSGGNNVIVLAHLLHIGCVQT